MVKRLHDTRKTALENPSDVQTLGRYDMVPIDMSSAGYTKFAQETVMKEKALIEKLGRAKAS